MRMVEHEHAKSRFDVANNFCSFEEKISDHVYVN